MPYTTVDVVKKILGSNYGAQSDGTDPDLYPYVDTAHNVVLQAVECAADEGTTLTTTQRELMERWLAAYYYTVMDPVYLSRSTASASGTFATDSERYRNVACQMDPSGCLRAILDGNRVDAFWLGKPESEQIDYVDRD